MSEIKYESLEKEFATLEEQFIALEEEIVAKLTSKDIQDINDTLISEKKEYEEGITKKNKLTINLLVLGALIALGLFSGIILSIFICIPLIGIFIYKSIKLHKVLRNIMINDIVIGNLTYTKNEYMKRFD